MRWTKNHREIPNLLLWAVLVRQKSIDMMFMNRKIYSQIHPRLTLCTLSKRKISTGLLLRCWRMLPRTDFPINTSKKNRRLLTNYEDVFRMSSSSWPTVNVKRLRIDPTTKSEPTRAHLWNYAQEQRVLLAYIASISVRAEMAHFSLLASFVYAPLLVPKSGPAMYRFTVDHRPFKLYEGKQRSPIPSTDNELVQISSS